MRPFSYTALIHDAYVFFMRVMIIKVHGVELATCSYNNYCSTTLIVIVS